MEELQPFPLRVPNQQYALVSFVAPRAAQRAPMSGFRIYGTFATLEEARAHAEQAARVDEGFDIYVAEMYRWCPWYPDPLDVQEPVYSDPQLDAMLREHRRAQADAQRAFDERLDAREKRGENSDAAGERCASPSAGPATPTTG
jgi:hypothetical protein